MGDATSVSADVAKHRCLVAVSRHELNSFLPRDILSELGRFCTVEVLDSGKIVPAEWENLLRETRAQAVIGSWTTPPLPPDLPLSDLELGYYCSLVGSIRRAVPETLLTQGLRLTNWGDSISYTIAEAALMMILMSLRQASHWQIALHRSDVNLWGDTREKHFSLFGRRVGIHGFGNVARRLVELLKPFNTRITVYDPYLRPDALEGTNVQPAAHLEDLFSQNDIIVELAALTPETKGIVSDTLLDMIPEGGVFVNTGRGQVVDEDALYRAAAKGRIRVALDVFREEPLPLQSPLRQLPDVVLFPHSGGPTADSMPDSGRRAVENMQRYFSNRPLLQEITRETYSRMT